MHWCRYIDAPIASLSSRPQAGVDFGNNDEDFIDSEPVQTRTTDTPYQRKYKKMSSELCEFLNDFGLLSFIAMNIQDAEVAAVITT